MAATLSVYKEVENILSSGKIKKTINILLLGPSGVGKSSFINSMIMAIDQEATRCTEYAKKGSYGAGGSGDKGAFTTSLRCFNVNKLTNGRARAPVTFWDFPGLPDSKDDVTAAIVSLLLDGCLEENASYEDLQKQGLNGLKRLLKEQDEERVINVVAYVHAANDNVQENLLDSVQKLSRDPARDLPIFLVITKADKLTDENARHFLEKNKGRMIPALGLEGCEEKVSNITNYCNEVTRGLKRTAELDENLLELWVFLLDPVYTIQRLPVPDVSRWGCYIM